jgi:hypothetical protein
VNPNRRRFLTTSSLALAAATIDWPKLFAQAGQGAPSAPQTAFTPLRRTVGYFTGQGGTIGYHISKGGVVVVDAQMPATAKICLVKPRNGRRPRAPTRPPLRSSWPMRRSAMRGKRTWAASESR